VKSSCLLGPKRACGKTTTAAAPSSPGFWNRATRNAGQRIYHLPRNDVLPPGFVAPRANPAIKIGPWCFKKLSRFSATLNGYPNSASSACRCRRRFRRRCECAVHPGLKNWVHLEALGEQSYPRAQFELLAAAARVGRFARAIAHPIRQLPAAWDSRSTSLRRAKLRIFSMRDQIRRVASVKRPSIPSPYHRPSSVLRHPMDQGRGARQWPTRWRSMGIPGRIVSESDTAGCRSNARPFLYPGPSPVSIIVRANACLPGRHERPIIAAMARDPRAAAGTDLPARR